MSLFVLKDFGGKPYRIYTPLMWFVIVVLLAGSLYSFGENGWSLKPMYYIECNSINGCGNDFYMSKQCADPDFVFFGEPLCTKAFLLFNEHYGVKPSFVTEYSLVLTIGVLIGWLLLNHVLFNRGFFKGWKGGGFDG